MVPERFLKILNYQRNKNEKITTESYVESGEKKKEGEFAGGMN